MPCNSGQPREQKTLCLCEICKPVQRSATTDRTLVMSRGKRFESARRLLKNAHLQVKRERRSERWDASRLHVLQPILQPDWPKGFSAWRFEGFNNPVSEPTSSV